METGGNEGQDQNEEEISFYSRIEHFLATNSFPDQIQTDQDKKELKKKAANFCVRQVGMAFRVFGFIGLFEFREKTQYFFI